MSSQRHIIKRQTLELRVRSSSNTFQLQNKISQLYRSQIISLIEFYFDQLSSPDFIHRIDQLEIDIGEINADALDTEFFQKVADELHRQLSPAIAPALTCQFATRTPASSPLSTNPHLSQPVPPNLLAELSDGRSPDREATTAANVTTPPASQDSVEIPGLNSPISPSVAQLELLNYFIQTGHLPWWAESLSQPAIDAMLTTLLQTSESTMRSIFFKACQNDRYLHRIIYQFSDTSLLKIVELLVPTSNHSMSVYGRDLQAICQAADILQELLPDRRRLELWRAVLLSLVVVRPSANILSTATPQPWIKAVVLHLATSFNINAQRLLEHLIQAIASLKQTGYDCKSQLPKILVSLNSGTALDSETASREIPSILSDLALPTVAPNTTMTHRLAALLDEWQSLESAYLIASPFRNQLQMLMAQARQLMVQLDSASEHDPQVNRAQMDGDRQITHLVHAWNRLKQEIVIAHPMLLENGIESGQTTQLDPTDPAFNLGHVERWDTLGDSGDRSPSPPKIYIHNAGLIVLWPFLSRLFDELGYLQTGNFLNAVSAERAVLLLQYLVDAATMTPEFNLPLNKLLCGLDIQSPVPASFEVLESEQTGCETLLLAVIQHWSVLKNTSIAGLRQAFLQREGILSIRDSHWLLQVERKTYDILLDRLPWSIRVVKLPWMPDVLHVEW